MINFIDIFIELKFAINEKLNQFNDLIFKKDRKLNFNSVFLFICKYNSNDTNSYNSSISSLIIDNVITDVSKTAFILKLKSIDYTYFIKINDMVINFFYNIIKQNNNDNNHKHKKRLIAIDGSKVNFKKSLNNEFKLSNNKNYTTANISCLFDIDLKIPINYLLSKSFNERDLLIEQLNYVNENDIIIADRGYFSYDVINLILKKKSNFIFRIDKNKNFINYINKNESSAIFNYTLNDQVYKLKIYKYNSFNKITHSIDDIKKIDDEIYKNKILINKNQKEIILLDKDTNKLLEQRNNIIDEDIKIKKEKIKDINNLINNNKEEKQKLLTESKKIIEKNVEYYKQKKQNANENDCYYLLTSCYQMTNNELIDIYQKRWGVETNFRFLKSNFKFDKLNSINLNSIKQHLYTCQFLFIIESIINYITPNDLIDKNNIISNLLSINKNTGIKINKNIKCVVTDDNVNNKSINKLSNKTSNKSLSLNLIGDHLLKSMFITKRKKKEKKEIYKNKKINKLFIDIVYNNLENIIGTMNEIIKNKVDQEKIKKNNIKNKKNKKRINMRPQKRIWI
jgi:hypothetical protein